MIEYTGCDSNIVIPDSITDISMNAFKLNSYIESVDLNNVTTLGAYSFSNCPSLTSVDFKNVSSIGSLSFIGCEKLSTLINTENVSVIYYSAFYDCTSLTNAEFINATTIGSYAFGNCSNLARIDLSGATQIHNSAFSGCDSLVEVVISSGVEFTDSYNFCYGYEDKPIVLFKGTPDDIYATKQPFKNIKYVPTSNKMFNTYYDGTAVYVEGAVQAKQYNAYGQATFTIANENGNYYIQTYPLEQSVYDLIEIGTWISVTGFKTTYNGLPEIDNDQDSKITVLSDKPKYIEEATEIEFTSQALMDNVNKKIKFNNLTITSVTNNTNYALIGLTNGVNTFSFSVEKTYVGVSEETINLIPSLNVGDIVTITGLSYTYQNAGSMRILELTVNKEV